jgi:integrase
MARHRGHNDEGEATTRRGNGEGTKPIKRKDGLWACSLRLGDGKRKSVYGKTPKEAREKLAALRRAHEDGSAVTGPSKKVGTYLDEWLAGNAVMTVEPTTFDVYRRDVERLRPLIGNVKLDSLRHEHIQQAYGELLMRLSPASVDRAHRTLKAALRHAVKVGLLGRNPMDRVTAPKVPRKEMRPLTPDEVEILLQSSQNDPLYALWVVLVTTGMRIGEACALRWADLDLEAGSLHVRQTLKPVPGKGLMLGEVKTEHSRRRIVLAPATVQALRVHQQRQAFLRKLAGDAWQEHGLVFCTRAGGPLGIGSVTFAKDRALAAAGLPRVRTHDLRHTAATYLLSQGVHPRVVQDLLGHSTITLTMDTYSHVLPSLHQEVAGLMDSLVCRARSDAS